MSQTPPVTDIRDVHRFFDVVEALAEESRRDIVADIVAHPVELPSMKELEFMTGLHRTTIHEHLRSLAEAGIVEVVEFPIGERTTLFGSLAERVDSDTVNQPVDRRPSKVQ